MVFADGTFIDGRSRHRTSRLSGRWAGLSWTPAAPVTCAARAALSRTLGTLYARDTIRSGHYTLGTLCARDTMSCVWRSPARSRGTAPPVVYRCTSAARAALSRTRSRGAPPATGRARRVCAGQAPRDGGEKVSPSPKPVGSAESGGVRRWAAFAGRSWLTAFLIKPH